LLPMCHIVWDLGLSQVESYLTNHVDGPFDNFNISTYWSNKKETWPKLAEVARHLLGVPAASTPSERSFSIAGRTIEDRRTQLSPDSVDGLLFLHGLPVKE